MSKIAITADIHFGVPGRLDDIVWACETIRSYCQKNDIDKVFVLGDLYHNRQAIEIDVNSTVCKFFEQTSKKYNQEWVVFPGNHDMFLRHSWEINSLSALKNHLTVIEDIKIIELDDKHRFWILPFITYERAYIKALKLITKHPEFRPNQDCLFTHIGVRSATLNTCFLLKDWSAVDFTNFAFKRVYTGHFHSQQQVGDNVWYPGSPIPFKFDEGDVPHGFYVLDLDNNQHQFIDIWKVNDDSDIKTTPPQFKTIIDEMVDDLAPDDIDNCMIRVALQTELTNNEKIQLKKKLLSMGARSVRWMDIKQNEQIGQEAIAPDELHKDLFRNWVDKDSKNNKDLNENILLKCNNEVVLEGDEAYSIEHSG
tara:strand:+ start:38 stop:1138 length:1101 start_codon:yes stop_codon:yes gene_type:complete